jgi:cyclopropane-fatty-acyl-phospholipid synthase
MVSGRNKRGWGVASFTELAAEKLIAQASSLVAGELRVVLPGGQRYTLGNGTPGRVSEIVVHDMAVFDRLMTEGWVSMGDTYVEGLWSSPDLQGFMDHVYDMDPALWNELFTGNWITTLVSKIRFWLQRNHRKQARKNISHHYDLGNAFYGLWLDDTMTYSSALFETGQESTEKAQIAKYKSMVDQMGVEPGDHILEIGCGWGGFAEYAAKERGLRVTGLTISEEQFKYAQERIEKAGLSDLVTFKLQDYRDEQGLYDGIASIEMFEAVGEQYWPVYFNTVRERLKPGKSATLQIITVEDARWEFYRKGVDFIQKYIFPGGMLPSPAVLRAQVERAGLAVDRSIEFGQSYSITLRRWHDTFNEKWDQVAELGFDARFRRMWNFYLTSCASTFSNANCDVTQITIRRPA